MNLADGQRQVVVDYPIASQMRPTVHPDGKHLVVGLPSPDAWDLWIHDVNGGPGIRIVHGGRPIMPTWSADGTSVFFIEANRERQFQLRKVARAAGTVSTVQVLAWNWGEPTATVRIRTRRAGNTAPLPSRLHIADRNGHPAIPDSGQVWFDGQNGRVYYYSPGLVTVQVPAGDVKVMAAAGFGAPATTGTTHVSAGQTASVDLEIAPIWNAQADGWYSGDHHFHMNYGGPYTLEPGDLVLMLQGEDLDVATPLMANLHTRVNDLQWFDWKRISSGPPLIAFGQEIRPHFLGHMGLLASSRPIGPGIGDRAIPLTQTTTGRRSRRSHMRRSRAASIRTSIR